MLRVDIWHNAFLNLMCADIKPLFNVSLCLMLVILIVHIRVVITWSVPLPSPHSFFPLLTAGVTANVTNLVWKDYWGPIECVVMLIVSQQCDWMKSQEAAEVIYPLTFDLSLSSQCVCVCAGCIERADCMGYPQLSTLHLSAPPLKHIQIKHTPDACMPAQRHTWIIACQHIHLNRPIMFQRTDNLHHFLSTNIQALWFRW